MQTSFTPEQLADPDTAASEQILRKCVHCGFCTATCPTYVLLGDELDSPRGRIYLIKDMLENARPASPEVVKHVDRCLSCLACMTTCPSGVHYQHLVDHARVHIERTYRRPLSERLFRATLAAVLPYPDRFRLAVRGAHLALPFRSLLPERLRAMVDLAPARLPAHTELHRRVFPARGERKARIALLTGCVQAVLAPRIHDATIRVLNRAGAEVVTIEGCCGAIVHHLGKEPQNRKLASRLIRALAQERRDYGLDAIVVNASGCGTHVKDYGYLFRTDPSLSQDAERISASAKDVTEAVDQLGLPAPIAASGMTVAYHSACSMQHGQKLDRLPRALLQRAGYIVKDIPEGHLCCGSAGTYNLLQPQIADQLRERKLQNIQRTGAEAVATGNIGCMVQLRGRIPVFHTIELLDRATGGESGG
jgi:glycolate oxidase iron-sulfur subunit